MKNWVLLLTLVIAPLLLCAQQRYDILITEIMADPSPPVGLPVYEWIELTNVSGVSYNLQGMRVLDGSGSSGGLPSYFLEPGQRVCVAGATAASALVAFGPCVSVTSFPSLDNAGELLVLQSADRRTIHAVSYSVNWFQNALKAEGGWSLEMMNTARPCAGLENWTGSVDPKGGTPGHRNSVDGLEGDDPIPAVLHGYMHTAREVVVVYNKTMDSASIAMPSSYSLIGMSVASAWALPPLFDRAILQLSGDLDSGAVYSLQVSGAVDCEGVAVDPLSIVPVGIDQPPELGDVVINEILFNPYSNGYDYVEGINRSSHVIDLSGLFIANRNAAGEPGSFVRVSQEKRLLFPKKMFVATVSRSRLALHYHVRDPDAVFETGSLPSFADDAGVVIIADAHGAIIDELAYHKSWHHPLLDNQDGVSLERIDMNGITQDRHNWQSSATPAAGTPGYANSQSRSTGLSDGTIKVEPLAFSPNLDGIDDFVRIVYQLAEPGYMANVLIFDENGRQVMHLVRNEIVGLSGHWRWDGHFTSGQPAPSGHYIVFVQLFNLSGKVQQFKKAIALLR